MPKVRHICRTGSGIKEPQVKRESWPVIRQLALIMSAKSKGFNTVRITISNAYTFAQVLIYTITANRIQLS